MSEIRVGPTHGPRCVPGCDGYGAHARNCPDGPDYDPNWMDELTAKIKRDLAQRAPAPDAPAALEKNLAVAFESASATVRLAEAERALAVMREAITAVLHDTRLELPTDVKQSLSLAARVPVEGPQ